MMPEEPKWCWIINYRPVDQEVGKPPTDYPIRVFDDTEQCKCFMDALKLSGADKDYHIIKIVLGSHYG